MYVAGMGEREAHTGFWWGEPREWDHLGLCRKRQNNIKVDCKEIGLEYVDWVIWVISGTYGRPLSMWWQAFGFHKYSGRRNYLPQQDLWHTYETPPVIKTPRPPQNLKPPQKTNSDTTSKFDTETAIKKQLYNYIFLHTQIRQDPE